MGDLYHRAYSSVGYCSVCPAPTLERHTECCLLNGTPPPGAQFPARPADNFCLPPALLRRLLLSALPPKASPGPTTGSAIRRSPPCSRRFRARASSSTVRRRRRTPRSPRPAPSFASPTASRCSPGSTANSRATPPLMPAPAQCDTRGREPSWSGPANRLLRPISKCAGWAKSPA